MTRRRFIARNWIRSDEFYPRGVLFTSSVTGATALSLRRMRFSPGWEIETQATYWRKNVLSARRAGLGRPDYVEVRYEDLILSTRVALERICAFVGLSYEDSMLTYYTRAPERLREHKGRLRTDGTPLLTQEQRLHQRSVQQNRRTRPASSPGKRSMSTEERRRFPACPGDLLKDLGYEV